MPLFAETDFDNRFATQLPADLERQNYLREVRNACFSYVAPTEVRAPKCLAYSKEVAQLLGLTEEQCATQEFADVFAGNKILPGMQPYAVCYGGHQFGHWAGQLGDGRAIALGEIKNAQGKHWEVQLKGAGPTPYSRRADGRAVLRSSVREFLCSEAMHHLGVPTTRALSLVTTGEKVWRDMMYDGNPKAEPGAVVCRVAPSFLRLGNYQILAARNEIDNLKKLVDFTITNFFSHLGPPSKEVYGAWVKEVCERTAHTIVHWMRVGFVHGVMNTDNLSVLGLTIDYGPYGWLENYDPNWTPNTTDAQHRRYRYGAQPEIGLWNLHRFVEAIHPLINEVAPLEAALQHYAAVLQQEHRKMFLAKLGLADDRGDSDTTLIQSLLQIFEGTEIDMTLFFRALATIRPDEEDNWLSLLLPSAYQPEAFRQEHGEKIHSWLSTWVSRGGQEAASLEKRAQRMNSVNPKYVLRNYLAQLAIDEAEAGNESAIVELLAVLRKPYEEQPGMEKYAAKRPEWARHRVGCSMLSCSS